MTAMTSNILSANFRLPDTIVVLFNSSFEISFENIFQIHCGGMIIAVCSLAPELIQRSHLPFLKTNNQDLAFSPKVNVIDPPSSICTSRK